MHKLISFSSSIHTYLLPEKFNYPYNYTPHPIAKKAVKELQNYLQTQTDFIHDFGIKNPENKQALGKMFGVLVVKNKKNEIRYLTAFSGKLANQTLHKHFVPPVFDVLDENGVYKKTEKKTNFINKQLIALENNIDFLKVKKKYTKTLKQHQDILEKETKLKRTLRRQRRINGKINNQLNINEEFYLREYEAYLNAKIASLKEIYEKTQLKIDNLKKERKEKSAWAQQEVFKQYQFLNSQNKKENLLDIFNKATFK